MKTGIIQASVNGLNGAENFAYFFNGRQYSKYDWVKDKVMDGYPAPLNLWKLPGKCASGIDAAFNGTGESAGKTYFFRDDEYVRYDWTNDAADEGYPLSLAAWNLPGNFATGIDAAVNGIGDNAGKVYFFKGNEYVRYDLVADAVDEGYPLSLSEWKLPGDFSNGIDAVINGKSTFNGKLYFFKGGQYVRFDWEKDEPDAGFPQSAANWGISFGASPNLSNSSFQLAKDFYTVQAFSNAGINKDEWQPSAGFAHNRSIILKVYQYYTDTYNKAPGRFLWAGLGKMAGGVVVEGLDKLTDTSGDTDTPVPELITIGKNIFLDLAWLHEAFLDDALKAITLAKGHDADLAAKNRAPAKSYEAALTLMNAGDADSIAEGNKMLLENEQHDIIEPIYKQLVSLDQVLINRTSAFVSSVHPYHRDFILDVQQGNVLVFEDRWKWITAVSQNMWDQWIKAQQDERTRLVNISMDNLMKRNFGKILPDVYTGADDE